MLRFFFREKKTSQDTLLKSKLFHQIQFLRYLLTQVKNLRKLTIFNIFRNFKHFFFFSKRHNKGIYHCLKNGHFFTIFVILVYVKVEVLDNGVRGGYV